MLLDLLITVVENIYCSGITHDDHHMTIVTCFSPGHRPIIQNQNNSKQIVPSALVTSLVIYRAEIHKTSNKKYLYKWSYVPKGEISFEVVFLWIILIVRNTFVIRHPHLKEPRQHIENQHKYTQHNDK